MSAIKHARELDGTEEFKQAVELIKGFKKDENCPVCNNPLPMRFSENELRWITGKCFICEENKREAQKREEINSVKAEIKRNINSILKARGIPKRYFTATIENCPMPFCENTKLASLYLHGDRGVGKTYLVCALAINAIENTEPVLTNYGYQDKASIPLSSMPLFVSVPDLLLEIRDSFNQKGNDDSITEKMLIEKYSTARALILDDLGAEKTTDWALQTLYTLIDRRYREELVTLITSNLSVEELSEKIGDRIASRIVEMCQVKILKGEDRRLKR